MKIVDEFTGRVLEGRRYSEGLHQAIEAKEGVKIKEENQTLATITLQNYFRLYEKLAGMTGTAETEAAELAQIYGFEVLVIPTNRAMVEARSAGSRLQDRGCQVRRGGRGCRGAPRGRPAVLLGTVSIEKSERLSRLLHQTGSPHEVLNAKHHAGRRRSLPRPVDRARSPWPPTWPDAGSTSCSAAIPRVWPKSS